MLFQQTSEEVDVIDSGDFLAFKTSNVGGPMIVFINVGSFSEF